jgi:hypothetical protein
MLPQAALVALCPIDRRTVFDPAGLPWLVSVVHAEQSALNLPVLYTVLLTSQIAPEAVLRVGVLISVSVLKGDSPELTALAHLARWLASGPPRSPAIIVDS